MKKKRKRRINSRDKGVRGELEFAQEIEKVLGVSARRGQQFSGVEGKDVICEIEGVHWEVKRVESFHLYNSLRQAVRDAGEECPVVATRRNAKPGKKSESSRDPEGEWIVCLSLNDLSRFISLVHSSCPVFSNGSTPGCGGPADHQRAHESEPASGDASAHSE